MGKIQFGIHDFGRFRYFLAVFSCFGILRVVFLSALPLSPFMFYVCFGLFFSLSLSLVFVSFSPVPFLRFAFSLFLYFLLLCSNFLFLCVFLFVCFLSAVSVDVVSSVVSFPCFGFSCFPWFSFPIFSLFA